MPVANVIDKRTNKYDVVCQAIFEAVGMTTQLKGQPNSHQETTSACIFVLVMSL